MDVLLSTRGVVELIPSVLSERLHLRIREIRDSDEMLWVIGIIDIPNLCHVFEFV